jgi:hypothetical protein
VTVHLGSLVSPGTHDLILAWTVFCCLYAVFSDERAGLSLVRSNCTHVHSTHHVSSLEVSAIVTNRLCTILHMQSYLRLNAFLKTDRKSKNRLVEFVIRWDV